MAGSRYNATVIAAVITVVGSIAVALIANWDKFERSPTGAPPAKTVESVIKIAGHWRDPNMPGNGSRITQVGNSFQFTGWGVLPQGIPYESSGSGTVNGQNITSTYTARYRNGLVSSGNCWGTVSPDGLRMTITCQDSLLGTFVSSDVRE